MGILRSDIVTHSSLEPTGGSIVLDGVGDYLTFAASNAFSPATSDVTFELWFYLTDDSDFSSGSGNYYLFDMGSNGYRIQMYEGLIRFGIDGSTWTPPASGVSKSVWHHAAGVRQGNSLDLYLDGNHVGQKSTTASVTSTSLTIGNYGGAPYDGEPYGYISNFRFVKGVVYDKPFTPPKFELKNIAGTIVLGCQSSSSATDFAVTPSAITAQGNAAASSFHPDLKKDITDTGVVFTDNTKFDTLSYMVPPGGTTAQRGRGRGLFPGGNNPSYLNNIDYIQIQSLGNAIDFGDAIVTYKQRGSFSSQTRAVSGGGYDGSSTFNVIDYVTMATTGNSSDFGDLTVARRNCVPAANSTRGVWLAGGTPTIVNTIDYITIASAGNATDFGDALDTVGSIGGGSSSPTRAIFAGGAAPAGNTITYLTIATTGNSADFGDILTGVTNKPAGTSSATRGLIICGENQPTGTRINTIQYVTIASLGNATDFGDNSILQRSMGACSNSLRAVYGGGNGPSTPTALNTLSYVEIATTGNGQDFGDLTTTKSNDSKNCSDSHGGIS